MKKPTCTFSYGRLLQRRRTLELATPKDKDHYNIEYKQHMNLELICDISSKLQDSPPW